MSGPAQVALPALLAAAAGRLAEAGVPSPAHDARALLAHVLRLPVGRLVLVQTVDDAQRRAYDDLVDVRARRVPLQHLTGRAGFRHLDLAVGPGVFVPRPETERLVEWGLSRIAGLPAPLVVDLCAGSGVIALSVAQEHPGARVHAVEREPLALAWARRNAADRARAGDTAVTVQEGDVTDPGLLADLAGRVDLVLANPPYVPAGSSVEPEVAEHDPAAALWGGADGLAVVRAVLDRAAGLLRSGGWCGLEHADVQGASVPALFDRAGGWSDVVDHPDLAGRPRFAVARRQPDARLAR